MLVLSFNAVLSWKFTRHDDLTPLPSLIMILFVGNCEILIPVQMGQRANVCLAVINSEEPFELELSYTSSTQEIIYRGP